MLLTLKKDYFKNIMSYNKPNYRGQQTKRNIIPEMVAPDLDNGLESVSCKLAEKFYNHHSKELHRMKNRDEIRRYYVSTVGKWAASRDGPGARHFNQVLYALCRDGKVCRLTNNGKVILWKANIPREKLIERGDRLAAENRELKAKLSLLEKSEARVTDTVFTPSTPLHQPPSNVSENGEEGEYYDENISVGVGVED